MDLYYECMACKKLETTPASLNKHINECKYYNEFIKTYKPPKYIECSYCNTQFISKDKLKIHTCIRYQ